MTPDIAAILAVDGIANGAIYVLVAIGLVLIFTVTRVIFVPFGDIAAFAALTLAALDEKRLPGTAGLVLGLAALATLMEATSLVRLGRWRALPRALGSYLALPALAVGARLWPSPTICRCRFASFSRFCWFCRSRRCSIASSSVRSPTPLSSCC